MTLYKDSSSRHDSSKNLAARGRGLFSLYINIENFKNHVSNLYTDFNITLQECFFCNPLWRLFKPFWFVKKHGRQRAGLIFPIYLYRNFKNLLVRNHWTDFNITWRKCFLGDPLQSLFKQSWFVKKHGCQGPGLIFPIYLYRKLVRNHWTYVNIAWQKCSFVDPLPRLFKPSWYIKKTWLLGVELIFPIYLYRKL